jgi:integrase
MKKIDVGAHKLLSRAGQFSGIIYGHGFRDSYSMSLGARLNDPEKVDTVPPKIIVLDSCGHYNITVTDITADDPNATGID